MLAHQLATPAQRAELDRGPAGPVNPADGSGASSRGRIDVGRLADVIAETGAVQQVEALIRRRVTDAVNALADAPIHDHARNALTDLAVSATRRPA
jgi:geranylgeranyl diphosphate synthase type I